MMELERLEEIIIKAFDYRTHHLRKAIGNPKSGTDLHVKNKAIDKMWKIRKDVLRYVREEYKKKEGRVFR